MNVNTRIQEVVDATEPFSGTIGIVARSLQSAQEISVNADTIFPTASTFKTVLLYELFRQVDSGKIDLSERIEISDSHRVPGSGVIQDLDEGASLTIKDIAMLMIITSDNSATDIIFDLLGKDAIAQAVNDLGMNSTSLPLPTWGILVGLHNLDPDDTNLTFEELKRLLTTKDAAWNCNALKETPDNDITTPRDLVRLYEAIEAGEGLSDSARDGILDILKRQKVSDRIPAYLPLGVVAAHKTGSIKGVRNDAGIIYAPDGTSYAVAIMVKGAEESVAATGLVANLSRVIYEHFVGPIS